MLQLLCGFLPPQFIADLGGKGLDLVASQVNHHLLNTLSLAASCHAMPVEGRMPREMVSSSSKMRLSALCGAVLLVGAFPVAAKARDLGFAVTWFAPALYFGDGDCEGNETQSEMNFKAILLKQGKSSAEADKLLENTFSPAFAQALLERGAGGANVCSNPESVPDPGVKTVIGKFGYGMDLDGSQDAAHPAPNTCAHDQFESPASSLGGAHKGIDNQLYRVLGCLPGHRGPRGSDGFTLSYMVERMRSEGLRTYLIELQGVDDLKNDDDVTVAIYLGADPLIQDGRAEVQPDSTQRIEADPRWHNEVKARIKDGVLSTDIFELKLLLDPGYVPVYDIKDARLQLAFKSDGGLKGEVGGYVDWKLMYFNTAKAGVFYEVGAAGNCPGAYYAYKRFADGYPDPQTGQCTAISSAFAIEATPAFLIHPPAMKKVSAAEGATRTAGGPE
jgi:hypothetical protein